MFMKRSTNAPSEKSGFTLVELLVVLSIVALMLTLAIPKYFHSVDKAREATLRQDLNALRESIDKFYGDQGRYPDSLEELVQREYLRAIPPDPITESTATWTTTEPEPPLVGRIYNIHSGSERRSMDGTYFNSW